MGVIEPLKSRNAPTQTTFSLAVAVAASLAAHRDAFRELLGSEPILQHELDSSLYQIATYGAGEFRTVGQFSLAQLPGCCGVVVLFHASVVDVHKGKGLGALFLRVRETAAKLAGYSFAQATVLSRNTAERRLLEANGWKPGAEFLNRRTKNKVVFYTKSL